MSYRRHDQCLTYNVVHYVNYELKIIILVDFLYNLSYPCNLSYLQILVAYKKLKKNFSVHFDTARTWTHGWTSEDHSHQKIP